ncbi:hypothetical protein LguiA_030027 [Lonicera macranthoides]
MGKYMKRKSKTAAVEASPAPVTDLSQSPLGVRTRAKTLALRRCGNNSAGGSFLQLRNRRLEKPQICSESKRQNQPVKQSRPSNPNPNPKSISNPNCGVAKDEEIEEMKNGSDDLAVEASFGENVLEFEGHRSSRETTPCSLIKNPETIRTPGSTNKRSSSIDANRRVQNSTPRRLIPTAQEINEFFAAAEEQHHRRFMDKYNFDPVKGSPLVGRYEWVKVNP